MIKSAQGVKKRKMTKVNLPFKQIHLYNYRMIQDRLLLLSSLNIRRGLYGNELNLFHMFKKNVCKVVYHIRFYFANCSFPNSDADKFN